MGILGTSKQEESRLREAALGSNEYNPRNSVDASSYTASLAYETADEDLESVQSTFREQNTSSNDVDTVDETNAADDDDNVKEFSATTAPHESVLNRRESREDELNRQFTLDRITSHRSYNDDYEDEFQEELQRSESHNAIPVDKLDWDGPDDKDNPQNWSQWKKWFITFTVAFVCLCVSLGSSLYVSGVPEIEVRFGVSQELAISGLTFYLVGLALGPVLMAPLSEIIGRRWIYITSFPISMLFTMGVGLSKNITSILVLRFFTGYIASPALSIAGGTVTDLWGNSPSDLSIAVALFCVAPFLGPVIGPIIGGFAAENKGWKWTMWISLIFSGFTVPFLLLCPETYKPIILRNRAIKRGIKIHKPKLDAAFIKTTLMVSLVKPITMLFVEPIVCLLSIYIAFIFAVLFGFFEAFPIIFNGTYNMTQGISGLPFIGVGIGLIGGVIFYIILDKVVFFPKQADGRRGKYDENGNIIWDAPEKKLMVGKIGAVCLPIALFWLGWTGRKESIHWMAPTAAGVPFGFGLILVFFAVVLYFSMCFPPISVASALAANNLLRYLVASVFPLFTVQMYEKLKIGWATSLFAFIALAMVPLPFVFGIWGPGFRSRSKYGYAAYFKALAQQKAAAQAAAAPPAPAATGDETITENTPTSEKAEQNSSAELSVENKV